MNANSSPGNRRENSRKNGQSLVELAAGLLVFVPIVLILIDCLVLALGASTNEEVCRDAARAAASGPPSLYTPAVNRSAGAGTPPNERAKAVIKRVFNSAGVVSIEDDVKVLETVKTPVPATPHGGAIIGEVSVETTAVVYPPFLVRAIVEGGQFKFKSTRTYPFTYIVPNTES